MEALLYPDLLYPDFLNDLCKLIVCHCYSKCNSNSHHGFQVINFIDRINFYLMTAVGFFKSAVLEIRSNAVLFVGKPSSACHYAALQKLCNQIILIKQMSELIICMCYANFSRAGYLLGNMPTKGAL